MITEQPPLFDLAECESHLVRLAGRDQERFSGTTIEKDRELVAAVLGAVVAGVPRDHIARLAGISTHTIAGIVDRAESGGEIAPWKQRMSRQLARATESLAASLVEAADNKTIPVGQQSVSLAILVDKKLILDGEATSRVEVVHRVTSEDILRKMGQVVDVEAVATVD